MEQAKKLEYGPLSEDPKQKALAEIFKDISASSASRIAGILAEENMYIDWKIFLGSDEAWERELGQPRSSIKVINNGQIGIYGTMNEIEQDVTALKSTGLNVYDPTESTDQRKGKHFTSLATESDGLFNSSALSIHTGIEGGGISQMETIMAAFNLLAGKPLTVRIDVPKKPKDLNGDAGKIWRSRMMRIADMAYLKAVLGSTVPLYLSVNSAFKKQISEDQRWILAYINSSEDNENALDHVKSLDLTNLNPLNLFSNAEAANEMVLSGSSNSNDESTRHPLLVKIAQAFPDVTITDTNVKDFASGLPSTKIQENDKLTGLGISPSTRRDMREEFHPPLINIIQATRSYGDLSQAALSFLFSVLNGTYTLLYLPKDDNASRSSDLFTFQSHLRKIIEIYPTAARHIRIAETPEELIKYIRIMRQHTQVVA